MISPTITLLTGDCMSVLPTLPAASVHCVVTSPPYLGMRDYDIPPTVWPAVTYQPMPLLPAVEITRWTGNLGLEKDPIAYIGHLVAVFREIWRVLRPDGTLWLNIGDAYSAGGEKRRRATPNIHPKNLLGLPWRLALAMQADGWYWRSAVIWQKPNGLPDSVRDRPSMDYEPVLLFARSRRYYYDENAVREPDADASPRGRSMRSVWPIACVKGHAGHTATFPPRLVARCIAAGASLAGCCSGCGIPRNPRIAAFAREVSDCRCHVGDPAPCTVLDPFSGTATTGVVALRYGHSYIGIDADGTYADVAERRIRDDVLFHRTPGFRRMLVWA